MSGCTWRAADDVHMPETWTGSCGALWTFTDGGLAENDMRYCPKCGGKISEARTASQASSKPKAYSVSYLGRGRLND